MTIDRALWLLALVLFIVWLVLQIFGMGPIR